MIEMHYVNEKKNDITIDKEYRDWPQRTRINCTCISSNKEYLNLT